MSKANEAVCSDGAMSVKEACEFSKLSRSELYNRMNAGQLQYVRVGRRRLVPRRALIEFLAKRVTGGKS